MRFQLVAAIFALIALGVQSRGARAADPYVIPVIVELTGANAYAGSTYRDALVIFQRYTSQTGGIDGRPLQFNFLDDESSPQVAVALATQVLAGHPAVVIGGTQTATCAAVAPLMVNGPLDFCISPAYQPPLKSFVFATSASLADIFTAHLKFAHLMGYHRIASIDTTDATGQVSDRTYAAAEALPENRDLTFLPVEHLNATDLTANAQTTRSKLGPNATADQLHDYIENLRSFPAASGTYDFTRGDQHGLNTDAVIFLTYNQADNSFVPATTGGGVPIKR